MDQARRNPGMTVVEYNAVNVPPNGSNQQQTLDTKFGNVAQKIIATLAVLVILYLGKLVFIVLLCSILLAFVLAPISNWLEHQHVPRPIGAALAMSLLVGA